MLYITIFINTLFKIALRREQLIFNLQMFNFLRLEQP